MKSKIWIGGFLILVVIPLVMVAYWTIKLDPYFHYHKPDTENYFYSLYNERSQNNGITRNFDYDGIVTGTSMTQNFKTSEAEKLFGGKFIKVSYAGGTYKEINDNLKVALDNNSNIKTIIRGLDLSKINQDKDAMREDLGEYPTYLYNDNIFDDVKYVFNRDVIFKSVYGMVTDNDKKGFEPGITSFDEYSNWMAKYKFGVTSKTVFKNKVPATHKDVKQEELTDEEVKTILANIEQNVTSLAKANPDVTFYYFLTPYSAAWWQCRINDGTFNKIIDAEKIAVEQILKVDNIKLYSFDSLTEINTDLNNFKDKYHYGEWINSLILRYMKDGKCLLTEKNYKEQIQTKKDFYWNFKYKKTFDNQIDYENDYYAAALLDEEIYGIKPYHISKDMVLKSEIQNAQIVDNQYEDNFGISCKGTLNRDAEGGIPVTDYIFENDEFCGVKITIDDISDYRYLVCYGKKVAESGQPNIIVYDENGTVLGRRMARCASLDCNWHQYLIDVSGIEGKVEIVFHGGYVASSGSKDSQFVFSDITLY